jgi:hypothetical protein
MKYVNILCVQNAELLNVKTEATHSYHCALKGSRKLTIFVLSIKLLTLPA